MPEPRTVILRDEPERQENLAGRGLDFGDLDAAFFLDAMVGPAPGLTPAEIALIRAHMQGDLFLSRVRLRCPFLVLAQRGRRTALQSHARYA